MRMWNKKIKRLCKSISYYICSIKPLSLMCWCIIRLFHYLAVIKTWKTQITVTRCLFLSYNCRCLLNMLHMKLYIMRMWNYNVTRSCRSISSYISSTKPLSFKWWYIIRLFHYVALTETLKTQITATWCFNAISLNKVQKQRKSTSFFFSPKEWPIVQKGNALCRQQSCA